ncbi:hypothetical protein RFI_07442 [Reticulomyxa filosa]|uniref:Uncharacterized protein n=1 Tax=Reticulomyxa filosa TaxID=46433 RepID=X6NUV3_RETFI|nr:hypothetical protein RFI_07442 [Reticulomyxa filosa]|eukprot:ETO29678.1 hypothetical protein RFI_07442 [Reticulomyxa filosa]
MTEEKHEVGAQEVGGLDDDEDQTLTLVSMEETDPQKFVISKKAAEMCKLVRNDVFFHSSDKKKKKNWGYHKTFYKIAHSLFSRTCDLLPIYNPSSFPLFFSKLQIFLYVI